MVPNEIFFQDVETFTHFPTSWIFLILLKIIDWRIPTIYIGTVFVLTLIFNQDPLFHILGGGLFIGAFFMATGYEGMPITRQGRI